MPNRMKQTWSEGGTAFGAWCMLPGTFSAELLGGSGFDYVCVDAQHGLLGYEAVASMLQALSATPATPIVRVPANEDSWIGKVLDAGAEGVVVPMVSTPEEAARAVASCRFAPDGVRSFGLVRAALSLGRDPGEINREVACMVMIETSAGVEAAAQICATPGVDGVYIGPSDLALSLGVAWDSPGHVEAIEHVRRCCEEAGIVPGIHSVNGDRARRNAEAGFRMVTVTADATLVGAGAHRELRAARHS